jgi:hypothetical protein
MRFGADMVGDKPYDPLAIGQVEDVSVEPRGGPTML